MAAYIETDFPIEEVNKLAKKEAPVGGRKPIYNLHKWWARRLSCVFRTIILSAVLDEECFDWNKAYYKEFPDYNRLIHDRLNNIIILDPFMGGGTTIVEGLKLGCKMVGVDIQPVAWFTVKKEIEPVDLAALRETLDQLEQAIGEDIKKYYRTTCPSCNKQADVMYTFWVKKATCPNISCHAEVPLFSSYRIATIKASKKRKEAHYIFCPECKSVFETSDSFKAITLCPSCGYSFNPQQETVSRGSFTCRNCGLKSKILDSAKSQDEILPMEMYAQEVYCPHCKFKGYKKITDVDITLYESAKQEFDTLKDSLLFPKQMIPEEGRCDPRPINYGYRYFYQMFNERQLLCLSRLLEQILKIEDENIREFFLIAFSGSVDYNNMFCKYNASYRNMQNLFSHHAFWPTDMAAENNVWGTDFGKGTFKNSVKKVIASKEYCDAPYETEVDADGNTRKIQTRELIKAVLVDSFEELELGKGNVLLKCQTSEYMDFLPDKSVDLVITDPPYCDNVQYAELADFFHVWLWLGLNQTYECIQSELSSKAREIVKNVAAGKDDDFFTDGLTQVFTECNRVLKDDGLVAFTFHHKENWAWASVLETVLDSDFYIKAVYPIHAESETSTHIMNVENIQYDTIIVCRKRKLVTEQVNWNTLKDTIYLKAQEDLLRLEESHPDMSEIDIFVITVGKCLEEYSKNYPTVVQSGEPVTVEQAVNDISEIVEQLIEDSRQRNVPVGLDEMSRFYLLNLVGKRKVSFNELNRKLLNLSITMDDLRNAQLVIGRGEQIEPLSETDREEYLKGRLDSGETLTYIDKLHYLYCLYANNQRLDTYVTLWKDNTLTETCQLLFERTKDVVYQRIQSRFSQMRLL